MGVVHIREGEREPEECLVLDFILGLLLEEHILLVDSFVVEEFVLHEDLIDVHADEEIADENAIELEN